ncbi:MAG TPA: hypothetical protein VHZ25_06880 [Acidobacteriaceae bacterium]|jgi:hypothetical protein|nr:hypothetical protein [Acidobacteriaceae bacterium]
MAGAVTDFGQPGFIDWTPDLQPLMTYLSKGWNANPNWPRDNGSIVTLRLRPGQVPQVVSSYGPHADQIRSAIPGAPRTVFPPGSQMRSVEIAPTFQVVQGWGRRLRSRYYELGGQFKVVAQ